MHGCEGNTVFCLPSRRAQSQSTSTVRSNLDMGGNSVSDQSWSMLNWHPVTYGLSTTGMIFAVVFILVLGWCCIRHGGKKILEKIRAPRPQPDVVASHQEVQFVPPRSWGNTSFMPQGLPTYSAPMATSMPSLASTTPSSPPLYDKLSKMSSQLDKMSLQDSIIRNNQYRMMQKLEKAEPFTE